MSEYGEHFATAVTAELRAQKARKKISETAIASDLGVHRVSISRYFTGSRTITMPVFADLCRVLDLDVLEVFTKAQITATKIERDCKRD